MKKNNFCGQNSGNNSNFYSKFAYNGDKNSANFAGDANQQNNSSSFQNASDKNSCGTEKEYKQFYDKYSNADEDSLMNKMFEMAKTAKENGQLNNASLEDFYKNSSNMLSVEQRKKLRNLIDMLKD